MAAAKMEQFEESLREKRDALRKWTETEPADQKAVALGPVGEEAVHSHIANIETSVEEAEAGNLGTCTVCHLPVEPARLEMDYTCCVCIDHFSDNELRDLEYELELAQKVQRTLLPQEIPEIPGLEIAAYSRPAQLLGGDYFDFAEFSDGKNCIAIADVAGHGVSASLHMASIQAMLRSVAPTMGSPAEVVGQIHKLFVHNINFTTFVTLFLGAFDPVSKSLTYCNAGHNPPLVINSRTESSGPETRLEPTGAAIGLIEEASYQERVIRLQSDDLLLMYTDGLIEATNSENEMFGMNRLRSAAEGHSDETPEDVIQEIRSELDRFVAGEPLADDTTILVCRVD